ncbi:MAG: hypothetical protein ABSC23_11615 [Bryobacteraceae bacterium]
MSTRSTTHFIYGNPKRPEAIVYRHSDGYPAGAGVDLREFLDRCAKLKDPRLADPSYLAAKYVVFLAEMFNHGDYDPTEGGYKPPVSRLEFISVGVMSGDPGDIEYRYVLDCQNLVGGRPRLTCYAVSETYDESTKRDKHWSRWTLTEVPIPVRRLAPNTTAVAP